MNLDKVIIEAYEIDASIGVFEWEKKIKQLLVFDLQLFGDFSLACESDDISQAVNYAEVCEEIEGLVAKGHYELLEYLAEITAQRLLDRFPVHSIKLCIRKPGAVPKARNVGVCIERSQVD